MQPLPLSSLNTYSSSDGVESDRNDTEERERELHKVKVRRQVFVCLGSGSLLVGFLLAIIGLSLKWIDGDNFANIIGGYCAALATVLSVFQIMEHLTAFADPDIQSRIIRILVMVPLYAITSWIAMNHQGAATVLDLIRDTYESYAIYTFFSLMIGLLGGTDCLLRELMAEGASPQLHPWPFCRMKPYGFNPKTLHRIRISILQFMVLKPLCALIIIVLAENGKYKNPDKLFDFEYGYVYITFVYNVSITLALYGLMYFYVSTKELLKAHNPFMKFLCIKGVLFLSYWQSLLIAILDSAGVFKKNSQWDDDAAGWQDFLICCEMLLFALAHKFVFGAHEYSNDAVAEGALLLPRARQDMWRNLKLTLKHQDVRDDFKDAWNF
eukprot:TRINITY_DN6132_c0_g2_i1.p1 TRINITY_DN6132_c0_g2~~TRINITY_DN6132_c0_g2_i1.p1  ORF type:complete len:382 (+),score=62.46 TRINITY_DN6132_c0_g2_i1:33-1178(+)